MPKIFGTTPIKVFGVKPKKIMGILMAQGAYMSVAHYTSPYITIYKRSGDTFTKLADPSDLPASTGYSVSFSPLI